MSDDFYKFKKLARAQNEWAEAKAWAYSVTTPSAHGLVRTALTQIGRWGYRARRGIDMMDVLLGTDVTEYVCEKSHQLRKIANELNVPIAFD